MLIFLMKEMGWDYYTYMRQPKWLINSLYDYFENKSKVDKQHENNNG